MKVLVATDGSEFSRVAVNKCCEMFDESENTAVRIISVAEARVPPIEPFSVSGDYFLEINAEARKHANEVVSQAEAEVRNHFPDLAVDLTTKIIVGSPKRAIVEEAKDWGADIIIVGSHGYGFWQKALLGSVSDSVLHHAPCSVLVVR